jgi:hypothetical protein
MSAAPAAGLEVSWKPDTSGSRQGSVEQSRRGRDRRLHGGWLEVEEEADLWAHMSASGEERSNMGVLVHKKDAYTYNGLTVGLGTQKT